MASQLGLYNDALSHFGERKLASLAEAREPRRALDDVYSTVIVECLAEGFWRFARKSVQLNADDALNPGFGEAYAFVLPPDVVRIYEVTSTPNGGNFDNWVNEGGVIRSDWTSLYVTYISNDPNFGLNIAGWPPMFAKFVGVRLAERIATRITQDAAMIDAIEKRARKFRGRALSVDATDGPSRQMPLGTWMQSRFGNVAPLSSLGDDGD